MPELPTGLLGGHRLMEALDGLTSSKMLQAQYDFDKLPIQFRAVSTNLIDGKEFVFKQGSMAEAIRASIAIPMLFTPLEKDGMLLVDGGLVDNLPTRIAKAMGADIIIAVDATSPLLEQKDIRTFLDVIDQSISLQMDRNVKESLNQATIVLHPDLSEFKNVDYEKMHNIIRQGEEEADRHLEELRSLLSHISPRTPSRMVEAAIPKIDSISFQGLKNVKPSQLMPILRIRAGETVDPSAIGAGVSRLYATRLFDSVAYNLEPLGQDRYQLLYIVKEAPLNSLGASLRLDNDYKLVALAEFTARRLFNSASTATISAQFGGLEDYSATLRLAPASDRLFLEPKANVQRLERLDIRNRELFDTYTDKREGGQIMVGGSLFNQLEIRGGYSYKRVRIEGGVEPKRLAGSTALAGLVLRFNRDTLDYPDFPAGGMTLEFRIDKRSKSLGSDFDYSKWQIDCQRYFSVSEKSTFRINASAGYSRGPVPFYDLFFVGGHSFSEIASRQFLGLERDEFSPNQMAVVGMSYRLRIFSHPLSFARRGFLTGVYNGLFYSNRQGPPYEFRYFNGGGLGVAVDTMIGPVRAMGGWGEGGRFHFYFTFGPQF
jgi:NTE family protein